ncbi:hypothetical protein WSK_1072 [Novosphingobium sp. Rr 2-17]|nr:hypothetical protein WSK_1072 [Novosphingobium sp. Rr 2-17]
MRIALLAMMEPAGAGQPFARAFLRVAGASLAQHQLGLALALDCQRVICFARTATPELIALQHDAEDAGLQFAIATGPRQLAGLVTATDDLVVVSEGLFVEPGEAVQLLENRSSVVLVQPVEGALAAGFERIDLNRATAGMMRVPGQLIERLHELPADVDVPSALTRIALQAGVSMHDVPAQARVGSGWRMIRSEADAVTLENEWLRSRFGDGAITSPGRALARFAMVNFGSSLLHAGNASNVLSAGVLALLGLAFGLGWFGLGSVAFVFVSVAWVIAEASRLLRAAERHVLGQSPPAIPRADALSWLVDAVLALSILFEIPRFVGQSMLAWLYLPAMLAALLTLMPRITAGRVASWICDRAVLGLALAVAAAFGQVVIGVQLLTLGLVLVGLLLPGRRNN